jgi:hypothetical protein
MLLEQQLQVFAGIGLVVHDQYTQGHGERVWSKNSPNAPTRRTCNGQRWFRSGQWWAHRQRVGRWAPGPGDAGNSRCRAVLHRCPVGPSAAPWPCVACLAQRKTGFSPCVRTANVVLCGSSSIRVVRERQGLLVFWFLVAGRPVQLAGRSCWVEPPASGSRKGLPCTPR